MADPLSVGISKAKEAAILDQSGEFASAVPLYTAAIESLLLAIRSESRADRRGVIRKKTSELLDRVELLRSHLGIPLPKPQPEIPAVEECLKEAVNIEICESSDFSIDDSVGGYLEVKEKLLDFLRSGLSETNGQIPSVLLFGPPGVGKTLIGKLIFRLFGTTTTEKVTLFHVFSYRVGTRWAPSANPGSIVRRLFDLAREMSPSVIFLDEGCEKVFSSQEQHEGMRVIRSELAVRVSGVGCGDRGRVVLICASNNPRKIDLAFRKRLFEQQIYVRLPTTVVERIAILRVCIGEKSLSFAPSDEDLAEVATACDGMTGLDISELARDVFMHPVRLCQEATHFREIEEGKFSPCLSSDEGALERKLSSIPPDGLVPPDVTKEVFLAKARAFRRSVDQEMIDQCEEYARFWEK